MLQQESASPVRLPADSGRRAPESERRSGYAMPESYGDVLADGAAALWRRRWLVALVFATTIVATYVLLQLMTETYEAKAQLLVKLGRENVEISGAVEKGGVVTSGVRKEEINSGVLLLSSRDLLAETIDEIGVAAFQPQPAPATSLLQRARSALKEIWRGAKALVDEALIALNLSRRLNERERIIVGLESALKVAREGESDVISVALRLPDPDLAVRIVDAHIRHYLERHVNVRRQGGLFGLFEEQADHYARRLEELELDRQRTRGEFGLTSIDEERRLLLSRFNELDRAIEVAARERDMMSRGQRPAGGSIVARPSIQPLLDRLAALQLDRAKLLRDYDPDSKPVADAAKEIGSIESMMLARFDAEIETLQKQATAINLRLGQINEGERRLVKIEREYELGKRHYLTYSQRLEDTRIASEFDVRRVANVSVLSRATYSVQTAYPPKMRVMLAAVPVGLLLGVALAYLLEYLNDSVRTARDLGRLRGIEFLGSFARKRSGE